MNRRIGALLVVFGALGVWYSVTTPLFETPDEREHFAVVQHLATGRGLPVQSEQPTHLAKQEGSQPPLYYALASALTFWIDTSDFPAIAWENPHYGYNVPGIVNDNKNLFIHTAAESFPYRNAVLAMRLARWLSVLFGALAVLFTYLLAREIFPAHEFLALSAAAIVAFTPQFLFISGAVSNDTTITALSACALWLIVRTIHHQMRTAEIILLGVVCGLAAIAKVSGAGLFVLAIFALALKMWRDRRQPNLIRTFTFYVLLFTFTFSLVSAWWYLRNLLLYGELTGTEMMSQIFFARQTPLAFDQLLVQLREVWETFWVGFGWGNVRAQPAIYWAIELFVVIGLVGLVKFSILRFAQDGVFDFRFSIGQSQFAIRNSQFAILIAWFAIVLAALVRWMIVTQAPHGRLMFPALPALAVLIVFGLAQFHALRFTHHVLPGAFALCLAALAALAPLMILRPAYAYPQLLNENDIAQIPNRVDIAYDDKIKLLGYTVSARTTHPGDAIELTLYWRALAPMDDDYSIGMRVLDANHKVIGARDSYPGHGMLPTRLWRAGQIIRDAYWLPINADAPPLADAQLLVSLYQRETRRDLVARDPRGEIITPFIGHIEVVQK